jgi:uncharacterized protein (TIGR03066 family)
MKSLFAFALGVVILVPVGRCAAAEDPAKQIVGKWEITKSEEKALVGATVEFTKDGKFSAKVKIDDKDVTLEGTYKVEGNKLTTKMKIEDEVKEDTDTITKLTDDLLELTDKDKKVTELKRKK